MKMMNAKLVLTAMVLAGWMAGCDGRPSLIPNKDASLRQTSAKFAADAAKRTYEADAPPGGEATARAEVNYTLKEIELGNLSAEDWTNVEVWVNKRYVLFLQSLPKQNKGDGYRHLNFEMFYDNQGDHLPTGLFSTKARIETVHVFREGKMYDVTTKLAD